MRRVLLRVWRHRCVLGRPRRPELPFAPVLDRVRRAIEQTLIDDNMRRIELFELCLRRIASVGRHLEPFPCGSCSARAPWARTITPGRYTQALAREHDIALIHVANGFENYFTNFATESAYDAGRPRHDTAPGSGGRLLRAVQAFDAYYESSRLRTGTVWCRSGPVIKQHRVQRSTDVWSAARPRVSRRRGPRGKRSLPCSGRCSLTSRCPRRRPGPRGHARMVRPYPGDPAGNPHIHLVVKATSATRSARRSPSTPRKC